MQKSQQEILQEIATVFHYLAELVKSLAEATDPNADASANVSASANESKNASANVNDSANESNNASGNSNVSANNGVNTSVNVNASANESKNAEVDADALPVVHNYTLEEVRAVLAQKSQAGLTALVRALINKYGGKKLSEVDAKFYPNLMQEAEKL